MRNSLVRSVLPALLLALLPIASQAGVFVGVSVDFAPPPLPVYVQPPCPGAGYIWTPGYWAWNADDDDYYWVPGTWVLAPAMGLLWTPGYWGWGEGVYVWHPGYWGPHVGFYGGINYGYGYTGAGFAGGYWRGHDFFYNRSVTNITNVHITNVYNRTVVNNVTVNHVSFNGGRGGIAARPTPVELRAEREHHVAFSPAQREHEHIAAGNHELRASVNGGRPAIAATARPAMFSGRGVVAASAAGGPVSHEGPHGAGVNAHQGGPRADRPPQAQHDGPNASAMNARPAGPRADRPPQSPHEAPRASAMTQHETGPRMDRPPQAQHEGPRPNGMSQHQASPRMDRPPQMQRQAPHSSEQLRGFEQQPRIAHQAAPQPMPAPREMAPHQQMAPPRPMPAPQQMPAPRAMAAPQTAHGEPHGPSRPEQSREQGRHF
jgi:WXXGXW repeat (2 copies)